MVCDNYGVIDSVVDGNSDHGLVVGNSDGSQNNSSLASVICNSDGSYGLVGSNIESNNIGSTSDGGNIDSDLALIIGNSDDSFALAGGNNGVICSVVDSNSDHAVAAMTSIVTADWL